VFYLLQTVYYLTVQILVYMFLMHSCSYYLYEQFEKCYCDMKVCNSPLLTDDPDENVSIVGTVNFSYMCSINSALHSLYSLYTVKNAGHGANSVKC